MIPEVSAQELAQRCEAKEDFALIDVREPWEVEICSLPGARHIPMRALMTNLANLPRDKDIVFICHSGGRTASIVRYLNGMGFENVYSLTGGLDAWAREIDSTMARY
jgi:rhodanese-related sulfurtransferase